MYLFHSLLFLSSQYNKNSYSSQPLYNVTSYLFLATIRTKNLTSCITERTLTFDSIVLWCNDHFDYFISSKYVCLTPLKSLYN